ncbi:MAG TPA: OmpA family protein [Microvirga sp.]|nr:OmpA family protein [Microvirga sp.]
MPTTMSVRSLGLHTARMAGLLIVGWASLAHAQPVSETQIIEALKPKGVTRGLSIGAPPPSLSSADTSFVESLRNRAPRTLSTGEREKLAEMSSQEPSIDLDVPFEFNSAKIGPRALPIVKNLGTALSHPDLKGGTFVLAGHTDAKGTDEFNQSLAEQRAEAVKRYLIENHGIPAESIVSVGYGETRLKNTADPTAAENRRVQATNLSKVRTTSR